MAQVQKMEVQVEIKSSAARVFQVFRSKLYLLEKTSPGIVKEVKLVKGDWESVGSIREWSYIAGNSETSQEIIEAIDDANKTVTLRAYGESIDKYYKSLKAKIQVTGSLVKWTMEYEKKNDDVPSPGKYLDIAAILVKNVDDYLAKHP